MLLSRESNDGVEAIQLELEYPSSELGHSIVATTRVVTLVRARAATYRRFCDHGRCEHTLNRAVECAGAHADLPLRRLLDFLRDCIAVPLPVAEREKDVQHDGRERNLGLGIARHGKTISVT